MAYDSLEHRGDHALEQWMVVTAVHGRCVHRAHEPPHPFIKPNPERVKDERRGCRMNLGHPDVSHILDLKREAAPS